MSNRTHRSRIARIVAARSDVSYMEALRRTETAVSSGALHGFLADPERAAQQVLIHHDTAPLTTADVLGDMAGEILGHSHGKKILWDAHRRFEGGPPPTILFMGEDGIRGEMSDLFRGLIGGTDLRLGPMLVMAPQGPHWTPPFPGMYAPSILQDAQKSAQLVTNLLMTLTRETLTDEDEKILQDFMENAYQEDITLDDALGALPAEETSRLIRRVVWGHSGRMQPVLGEADPTFRTLERRKGPQIGYYPVHLELPSGSDSSLWSDRDWVVHGLHLLEIDMAWELIRSAGGGVLLIEDAHAMSWTPRGQLLLQRLVRDSREAGILLILDAHEGLAPGTLFRRDVGQVLVGALSEDQYPALQELLLLDAATIKELAGLPEHHVLYQGRAGQQGILDMGPGWTTAI